MQKCSIESQRHQGQGSRDNYPCIFTSTTCVCTCLYGCIRSPFQGKESSPAFSWYCKPGNTCLVAEASSLLIDFFCTCYTSSNAVLRGQATWNALQQPHDGQGERTLDLANSLYPLIAQLAMFSTLLEIGSRCSLN